jgi:hypothetical protein
VRGQTKYIPVSSRLTHDDRPRTTRSSHGHAGREAVTAAIRTVSTVAADLTYKEVLGGETHHAAYFRLRIEDTVVNGVDHILLDEDGKIAEVTVFWRPLPSAVEMQGHLAQLLGMRP